LVRVEIQYGVPSQCAINADVISETYEDIATGKLQIRRFQRPHSGLTTLLSCKKRPWISTNDLYCQKLELLTYIFAADGMGLCLLDFTLLSLKVEPSESKAASTKTKFYMK